MSLIELLSFNFFSVITNAMTVLTYTCFARHSAKEHASLVFILWIFNFLNAAVKLHIFSLTFIFLGSVYNSVDFLKTM